MPDALPIGTYRASVANAGDMTEVFLYTFRLPRQTQVHAGWSLPGGAEPRYVGSYPIEDLAVRESRQQVLLNLRADFPDVEVGAPELVEDEKIRLPAALVAAAT